jgi:short-subunit dehydrogenase
MPKAIIVGATSGIGEALARELVKQGFEVGLAGRRQERLSELQTALGPACRIQAMDVRRPGEAIQNLQELLGQMGRVELIVVSAGISPRNPDWQLEEEIIRTNCIGFAAIARSAFDYFGQQGGGHLAGISSISALRGRGDAVVYSATKAFVSNYLQGLRQKAGRMKLAIAVTDIIPGFVDTPLIRGKKQFWVAPADKAGRQIAAALRKKKYRAYITKRWRLIAWFQQIVPDWLHKRM